jgi:adenosylmethionine-8-amino-7-oxononanoate aminotransferase
MSVRSTKPDPIGDPACSLRFGHVTGAFLHPFAPPAKPSFIPIVRGDGALVWDADGNEYLDGMASLWYCAVGHGRRAIADAVADQIATIEAYSCFDPFTNPVADSLAERLVDLTPMPDARVFLCQSGSEAVDTAMKIARAAQVQAGHPERTLIISRVRGYHGTNYGGTSAQGLPLNKVGWGELLSEVVQVPSDDIEALASLMAERSGEIAAVLTEPVQGAAGVWPPADGYLESVRRLCDQHGALLIFDEVITGFGRLGSWFAADHFGVVPDLTTFAKAVTSGYQPLGGVFVGAAARAALEADPTYRLNTGYTYSGHAAACAAALVNIDIIAEEGLLDRSTRIGERLGQGLTALADDGIIAGVRGIGAMWAAAMHPEQDAPTVRDRCLAGGLIIRPIGDHSITFCPPLVTTDEQVDRIVDVFAEAAAR